MTWLDQVLAEGEHAERMRSDLEYFARHALKLRPKAGMLEPFIFNAAQKKPSVPRPAEFVLLF